MNANQSTLALVGYLMLLLVACNQISSPALSDEILLSPSATLLIDDVQTETIQTLPALEPQKDSTPITPPTLSPPSSGLESLINKANEDLAQRLSISITEIDLVEAKEVVWPDASLGCPQPGMMYAQVLTNGYLIMLEVNGRLYEYHTSRGTEIIFCENPMPPVEGAPIDQ